MLILFWSIKLDKSKARAITSVSGFSETLNKNKKMFLIYLLNQFVDLIVINQGSTSVHPENIT